MVYAYLRVSTEKQTVENQRFEVNNWAIEKQIMIDEFVEEVMSGGISIGHRKLGSLSEKLKADDILIVSELSRLGRSLLNVMSFLNFCIENNIRVFSIKENFEFADNINSKVLAFAFSLAAEIERQLISQRTKEALARVKSEGQILGRKQGERCRLNPICRGNHKWIVKQMSLGTTKTAIARELKISTQTLYRYLIYTGLFEPKNCKDERWLKYGIFN